MDRKLHLCEPQLTAREESKSVLIVCQVTKSVRRRLMMQTQDKTLVGSGVSCIAFLLLLSQTMGL